MTRLYLLLVCSCHNTSCPCWHLPNLAPNITTLVAFDVNKGKNNRHTYGKSFSPPFYLFIFFFNLFCHIQLLLLIFIQHFPIRVDPGPILWVQLITTHRLIDLYLSYLSFWGTSVPIKSDKSATKLHIKLNHKFLSTQPSTMSFPWSTSRVQLTSKHSPTHINSSDRPSHPPTPPFIHEPSDPVPIQCREQSSNDQFSERVNGHFGKLSMWKWSQGPCKTERRHHSHSARFDHLLVPISIKLIEIYNRFQ